VVLLVQLVKGLRVILLSLSLVLLQVLDDLVESTDLILQLLVLRAVDRLVYLDLLRGVHDVVLQLGSSLLARAKVLLVLIAVETDVVCHGELFIQGDKSCFHSLDLDISFSKLELERLVFRLQIGNEV